MNSGYFYALIGGLIGLAGAAVGVYFSIKNTNSKKERVFMINANIIFWIGLLIFLGLIFFLPRPYNYLMWIPYGILLPFGIIKVNKIQRKIRSEENKK